MTVFWFSLFLIVAVLACREYVQVRKLSVSADVVPDWKLVKPLVAELVKAWASYQQCVRMAEHYSDSGAAFDSSDLERVPVVDCQKSVRKLCWKSPDGGWEERTLSDELSVSVAVQELCDREKAVVRRRLLRLIMEIRDI